MDADTIITQLLETPAETQALEAPLPDTVAAVVVERLKQEADRHWWINANRSLELADLIVRIGQARDDSRQIALGMMARGDALKLLNQIEQAWEMLLRAGHLFQSAGDEVSWARTCIGRLPICVDLHRVEEALTDAERARAIFTRHDERERLLRLDLNQGIVYDLLGDYRQALVFYRAALASAEALGSIGDPYRGSLLNCMGYSYYFLGDFRQAQSHYEDARAIFAERHETSGIAIVELNIAYIAQAQGHYRRALDRFHRVLDLFAEQFPREAAAAKRNIVECYLLLNRYTEARDLAQQVIAEYRTSNAAYETACTLLHLAITEAELTNLSTAQSALDSAEAIFASLGTVTWIATVRLRRGRILLQQGDAAAAHYEAAAAATSFDLGGQQASYAQATLLKGQAEFAAEDIGEATRSGTDALHIARRCNMPPLRYAAHLLLGKIAEARGNRGRAVRRYSAAAATVERVQRSLTITLRPGFLEDKGEALRALIGLHLRDGNTIQALDTLERVKSQALLGYLANREHLRWTHEDARNRALIEELDRLRTEHHWFYRLAHDPPANVEERANTAAPEPALAEVAARERRMRAITEQLYLTGADSATFSRARPPAVQEVQRCLDEGVLLIEFYNDGTSLWAFTLDHRTLEVCRLPMQVSDLDRLVAQLQMNLTAALNVAHSAPAARGLANLARRILRRLYDGLLAPLDTRIQGRDRLVIVPFGALHYLPFHLLHTGACYLIEQHEVVIQPAASLIARGAPRRAPGALALAHAWEGRLPETVAEAQIVQRLLGGAIYCDHAASRSVLWARPAQVLHIAAHGEHRLDQPDLSYIRLADGQLYTDDLLQHDLSYELVTLSACETGRARVAADDELIGLGRGFLYAGAGALITSLWRVADTVAVALMEQLYQALRGGASKAAALRAAQRAILADDSRLHPAVWGAFQLVGDASPLSRDSDILSQKEDYHGRLIK